MSNFLAIATVTATLRQLLQAAVQVDVTGANATMVRPDGTGTGIPTTGVNIYMYQATPNPAWRNADLPARRSDGQLMQQPKVALDLHYLLSFYGDESRLEPQRILGSVVRTLHARPVLTRQAIRDTIANPSFPFLAGSNLADEVELMKFTPLPLSLEELSKLWSVFFQTTYAVSVAYQGTVVLIEGAETPRPALPVRERSLYVVPFREPVIDQVISQAGADQPVVASSTLRILGRQLRGDVTQVRIGGSDVTPQDVSDTQITLPLSTVPAAALRAGVQGVQVVHPMLMGTPPVPHPGVESNVAPFVLRPTITRVRVQNAQGTGTAPRSADIEVRLSPSVGKTQRVVLLLNEFNPPPNRPARAYTFSAPSRDQPGAPETAGTITIPVSGVRAGRYLVRVQVDGAESLLTADTDPASSTFNQYVDPRATIP